MLSINPFAELATSLPAAMQFFVIAMVLLIYRHGTRYASQKKCSLFFRNAKKQKNLQKQN